MDDNFIGNQRNVKRFLRELIPWMQQHNYPFTSMTEASVNLAEDDEMLQLMGEAGFYAVFLGIETPRAIAVILYKLYLTDRPAKGAACH